LKFQTRYQQGSAKLRQAKRSDAKNGKVGERAFRKIAKIKNHGGRLPYIVWRVPDRERIVDRTGTRTEADTGTGVSRKLHPRRETKKK